MGFKLQMAEKLNNNSEEGYKIQTTRCLFFKKDRCQSWKEEGLTHKVTQQERHRGKTLKKQFWKVYWPKEGWRSVVKDKEVIALCVRLLGSVGALLTQGQGRQVQKTPKSVKNPKIAIQSRQLG
jgi:hypothetical protein